MNIDFTFKQGEVDSKTCLFSEALVTYRSLATVIVEILMNGQNTYNPALPVNVSLSLNNGRLFDFAVKTPRKNSHFTRYKLITQLVHLFETMKVNEQSIKIV